MRSSNSALNHSLSRSQLPALGKRDRRVRLSKQAAEQHRLGVAETEPAGCSEMVVVVVAAAVVEEVEGERFRL
jgi:hypothetical protein